MFFIVSKLTYFIFSPYFWLTLYLLFILLRFRKIKAIKHLWILFLLLMIFGNRFIVNRVFRWYETPPVADAGIKKTDVAVVLGGFSYYDFTLKRIHFNRSADRVFHAVRLYKKGLVRKILLSGGSGSLKKPYEREAPLIAAYLVEIGIPPEDLILDTLSRNTHENAVECARLLGIHGYDQSPQLLLSSGYHLPRALACFKKQQIAVIPYSVDGQGGDQQKLYPDDLILPSSSMFELWDIIIHEWFGFFMYKISGKC
jgi:uncharacterized SAM-binding protein YcdF (DUF218 family)